MFEVYLMYCCRWNKPLTLSVRQFLHFLISPHPYFLFLISDTLPTRNTLATVFLKMHVDFFFSLLGEQVLIYLK